jgi:hypothetical protein
VEPVVLVDVLRVVARLSRPAGADLEAAFGSNLDSGLLDALDACVDCGLVDLQEATAEQLVYRLTPRGRQTLQASLAAASAA